MTRLTGTPDQARYLTSLFAGLEGYIEVRSFTIGGGKRQTFCEGTADALEAVNTDYNLGCNVYVGMATRGEKTSDETGRISGGKDNLLQCRALWVDRDGLTEEGAREEWEVALEQFPMPHSMRINSGGGEHTYWLLDEPLELTDPKTITRLEHTLKGIADTLNCDQSATDASRILRVPDTLNYPSPEKQAKGRVEAACQIIAIR